MKTWKITVRYASSSYTCPAIGERDALIDAAYAAGALGVTVVAL